MTPYSLHNQALSDKAHLLAQTEIYPDLFGVERDRLEFTTLPENEAKYLDWQQGIDKIVQVKGWKGNLLFTIQERFRDTRYASLRDATITTWNHATNRQGELYKLRANLFLYGYYDLVNNQFREAVVFNIPRFLLQHIQQKAPYTTNQNPRSRQSFMSVKFDDLKKIDAIEYHRKWEKKPTLVTTLLQTKEKRERAQTTTQNKDKSA